MERDGLAPTLIMTTGLSTAFQSPSSRHGCLCRYSGEDFQPHREGPIPYTIPRRNKVQLNTDPHLPTQRRLLAQFCRDEVTKVALDVFNEQVRPVQRPVETGNATGLGGSMAW
jgi:hypothetical protein